MKKIIALILALCLLFSLGVTASAASTQKATITYRGIILTLNGESFIPCDEKGNTVEPFIMNSTTYLPLRALAQALGLGVAWDGKTNTVTLTSGGEVKTGSGDYTPASGTKEVEITFRDIKVVLDGVQLKLTNANGEAVEPFIMGGTTYLPLRTVGEALGLMVDWDGPNSTVIMESPDYNTVWVTTKETAKVGTYSSTTTYKYDEYGNQIQSDFSDNTGFSSKTLSLLDKDGMWLGESYSDSFGVYYKYEFADDYYIHEDCDPGNYHDYEYTEYNENGDTTYQLVEDRLMGEKLEYFYEYDADGKLKSTVGSSTNNGAPYSFTEVYEWNGNVRTNYTTFSDTPDFTEISTTTFTYDAQGRVIKEENVSEYYTNTVIRKYDAYGNEVYFKWTDSDGTYWEYATEFDADGRLILESYEDEEMSYTIKNEYNEYGMLISTEEDHPTEGYWTKTEWVYDDNMNLLAKRTEDNANYDEVRISYDANGFMKTIEMESAGEVYITYTVTTNDIGLMTKVVSTDGSEVYTFEYTAITIK